MRPLLLFPICTFSSILTKNFFPSCSSFSKRNNSLALKALNSQFSPSIKYITCFPRIIKNHFCSIHEKENAHSIKYINHDKKLHSENIFMEKYNNDGRDLKEEKFLSYFPEKLRPYVKLTRIQHPIGVWLLLIPGLWGLSFTGTTQYSLYFIFALGSLIMRSAGCTINDMWDRDFDKMVARTKRRPLANGELTYSQATTFLAIQLSSAFALLCTLNYHTIGVGISSMIFVISYPLMKRYIWVPQAFLGLTFNFGILMAWSSVYGTFQNHLSALIPLYLSAVCWTVVYDTIYAHQDKEDDILIGVKSSALYFGDKTKLYLSIFSFLTIAGLATTGIVMESSWKFFAGLSLGAVHLLWQLWTVDLSLRSDCRNKFFSNKWFGLIIWLSILIGN